MSSDTDLEKPVVAVITFPVAAQIDEIELRQLLEETGPRYTRIPGLRRKYFIHGEGVGGGIYEWDSRSSAEAFYNPDWYAMAQDRYGVVPQVVIYDAPAIADGISHRLDIFLPED